MTRALQGEGLVGLEVDEALHKEPGSLTLRPAAFTEALFLHDASFKGLLSLEITRKS